MLHVENPLPGMQKTLKPTTMLTFPSSYVRLPSTKDKELWQNCGFAQDADGKRINEDFFDAQTWRKLELGPFAFGDVPREHDVRLARRDTAPDGQGELETRMVA